MFVYSINLSTNSKWLLFEIKLNAMMTINDLLFSWVHMPIVVSPLEPKTV